MRKLKFQMQVSLDGFVAGPNGEMDWMTINWDQKLMDYVGELTEPIGTIVLGRKLAEGFIPVWKERLKDGPGGGAEKMVNTPKVVFTKTLTENPWENTSLATGELVEEINALKNQDGGDIMAYGGAGLASALIKNNLIDEYNLFVNPIILGSGLPIYQKITNKLSLNLVSVQSFDCGITALRYNKAG
ncbi:dihydrofolate reductase [Mucilaginibacter pallidiroseus]|uniref:Dihydrofolate reductase n=1 Tax=Mucilaginibacter pallidiroseus TaxID=2599295 RepID=A0A563TZ43_9SPHI|nr:dihydrofolate reductase family protein [Mucilaginibacter pallidiroseus]TWR24022.1 dihydrofolate reductase [Mucilaginibacter pallidiroseus]